MKKLSFILILVTLVQIAWAQDKLTRIESRDIAIRANDSELSFHDQEMTRMLNPKKAEFGVLCVPSFTPEWAITFDSKAHALVLKESEENIWYHKRGFDHWDEYTHKEGETRPKQYKSPKVKTYQLTIAADMVPLLTAIWKSAIGTADYHDGRNEMEILHQWGASRIQLSKEPTCAIHQRIEGSHHHWQPKPCGRPHWFRIPKSRLKSGPCDKYPIKGLFTVRPHQ